jgi:hypothetical protein
MVIRTAYRTLRRVLPVPLARRLQAGARRAAPLLARLGVIDRAGVAAGAAAASADMLVAPSNGKHPYELVDRDTLLSLRQYVGNFPDQLLQVSAARQVIARERAKVLLNRSGVKRVAADGAHVAHNTVDYNIDGARTAADLDRPAIMTNVVMGIEWIRQNVKSLDVLSIGPRSEIEIFALMGAGFSPERIRAVDLFSYSPYVDVGDMHALPYEASAFDIVFLGWVLSYSKDQSVVARELLRVCRDGALIVLAGDYSDDSRVGATFKKEATHMQSCDQLLALFPGHVGRVYFRHDPEPERNVWMVMTVFEVRKT